jgi:hypothetical protein
MGLEGLTTIDIIHGSFGLIFMIVSLLIGLKILMKYFSIQRIELVTVAFTWIFLSTAWWGAGISFVTYVFYGFTLGLFWYLFVDNVFLPFALLLWIYSFCQLAYPAWKRRLMLIYAIICIPYEIFLIIFLLIDPNLIGTMEATFNSSNKLYVIIFQVFAIATALITGFLFSRKSFESDDPKTQWKGRFLLIAFISFTIAALFDVGIPVNPITLVIARLILISSSILFYLGFFLPDKLADILTQKS